MARKFSENCYDIDVKGQCHIYLESGCMECNANYPLIQMSSSKYFNSGGMACKSNTSEMFRYMRFIFCTLIAYGV